MLRLQLEEGEREAEAVTPLADLSPPVQRHVRVLDALGRISAAMQEERRTKTIASSPVISSARLSESDG